MQPKYLLYIICLSTFIEELNELKFYKTEMYKSSGKKFTNELQFELFVSSFL